MVIFKGGKTKALVSSADFTRSVKSLKKLYNDKRNDKKVKNKVKYELIFNHILLYKTKKNQSLKDKINKEET